MRRQLAALVLGIAVAGTASAETPVPAPTPARVVYPGGLDRSFGAAGFAAPPASGPFVWTALALQPDGKIVVVSNLAVVARYEVNGALDGDFASGPLLDPFATFATAVVVTDGGDVVVVGYTASGKDDPAVVMLAARLGADGSLDSSFAGGLPTVDPKGNVIARAVLAATGGRVVVLADVNRAGLAPAGAAVLLRLLPNGALDPTFGTAGIARVDGDAAESFSAVALAEDRDGNLLIAANSFSPTFDSFSHGHVVRFDRDGHAPHPFEGFTGFVDGIAVLSDGTAIVDGSEFDDPPSRSRAFLRFDREGSIDRTFGDNGLVHMFEAEPGPIAVDGHGRIVVAGNVLARHFADGAPDPSFGADGVASGSGSAVFRALALQPDGKIVAAGGLCATEPHGGAATCFSSLARYESDRTQLCGDVDASGALTVTDGVATLRAAAGLEGPCSVAVCDVDGSGAIAVTDGVDVLRAAAALPAPLSCGIP